MIRALFLGGGFLFDKVAHSKNKTHNRRTKSNLTPLLY
ncbi:hypothetical protein HPCPY1962_0230 [Helicobacter pylori CPY1962]|nr:hypothetical protein HPCPY1962_0230 [Helicobacter pylori CPY1962]